MRTAYIQPILDQCKRMPRHGSRKRGSEVLMTRHPGIKDATGI